MESRRRARDGRRGRIHVSRLQAANAVDQSISEEADAQLGREEDFHMGRQADPVTFIAGSLTNSFAPFFLS